MSQPARIKITGVSRKELLEELDKIEKWDNGHNYPVYVDIDDNESLFSDTISNIRNAINGNIYDYIFKNFKLKNKTLKSGGNDDIYLIPDPNSENIEGKRVKFRKIPNKLPKVKRKKNKKTHRKK
jgi:hypothetical protein